MSIRYKGGILSATPPTLVAGAGASGAWTLEQQMQATAAGLWPVNGPFYVEDVFSTYLYTGNGATQTITNGINLATKGGLFWGKSRSTALGGHGLVDTVRGKDSMLQSNTTNAPFITTLNDFVTSFNTNGVSIGSDNTFNRSGEATVGWTFAKQPKFFDVVTYTGTGVARTVAHNLGSVPGCIIVKSLSAGPNWAVYHRGLNSAKFLLLSQTNAEGISSTYWNSTDPTSTVFTVGTNANTNTNGDTYVAYLFAHNAGGFGLTGADNVISCGSLTTDGSGVATVNLGYEPQWIMVKNITAAEDWWTFDVMRGFALQSVNPLYPNSTAAEGAFFPGLYPTATGFVSSGTLSPSSTYVYIAIRRGPMKTPTVGTSVFAPVTYASTNVDNRLVNTGIVTDMTFDRTYDGSCSGGFWVADRLRSNYFLATAVTDAAAVDTDSFMTPTVGYGNSFSAQNGFGVGNDVVRRLNYSTFNMVAYAFARAPGFFDEVIASRFNFDVPSQFGFVTHNLGVQPEMVILKATDTADGWYVYHKDLNTPLLRYLNLNNTNAQSAVGSDYWAFNGTTEFRGRNMVGGTVATATNSVASYLFATVAGVSKVGSYTGTAALQTVNCGFTTGARFILIKRTDSTGDWYVWDSARGISSGTDPFLLVNSIAIQDATTNYVDTDTTGFKVTAAASTTVNISTATYIFLAIA